MHIQEGKTIKKASVSTSGAKHCYNGGRNHQPKHACDAEKNPKKGIGAFVVAVLFLIFTVVFSEYAVLMLPVSVVSLVLSICAVANRKTGFSVIAMIVSVLASVIAVTFTVLVTVEYFTGISMVSFTIFS
ncbi:MAG: hypothetical protein IKK29_06995 [Christensenellaceae bacterium]|nr:hypothetical protein [Christensenellaceae bacterium]